MKRSIFLAIFALIIVAIASSMSYEQQSIVPFMQKWLNNKPFEAFLSQFQITYWNEIISVETRGYYFFVEFLVRKFTHFAGYGFIALILFSLYRKFKWRFAGIIAIISVFIIASLDELRQHYSPGRTGIFDDVLIDTAGAITFILIAYIVLALRKLIK